MKSLHVFLFEHSNSLCQSLLFYPFPLLESRSTCIHTSDLLRRTWVAFRSCFMESQMSREAGAAFWEQRAKEWSINQWCQRLSPESETRKCLFADLDLQLHHASLLWLLHWPAECCVCEKRQKSTQTQEERLIGSCGYSCVFVGNNDSVTVKDLSLTWDESCCCGYQLPE